jgi:hypothetical protein
MKISFKRIISNVRKRTREANLDTILSIQYIGNAFKKNNKKSDKK